MEEYIDKNKLIRDLIDNRSFYPAIVKNAIKNAPIEDVVPRSEVIEMLNEIEDNFEQGYGGVYEFKRLLVEFKKKYIGE